MAAIAVAAATVVANVVGVWWAGHTQRRLARAERLGEREIEAYLDLLRWTRKTQSISPWSFDSLNEVELAVKPPDDLDMRLMAFASERVLRSFWRADAAFWELNRKLHRDEDQSG